MNGYVRSSLQDLNGDGFPDLVTGLIDAVPRVWINQCQPEVLVSVTDGYDKTLAIDYARLNDPTPLSHSDKPVYTPYDPATDPPLLAGQIALQGGGLVVSHLTEPDGLGGTKCIRRHYGDLRYDRMNQASLGFGWVEVHEASCTRTGEQLCRGFTRTEMMREYPFMGSPEVVRTFVCIHDQPDSTLFPGISSGVKLVGLEENTYGELTSGPASIEPVAIRRPVQTQSVTSKYDPDDAQTLLSQVTTVQGGIDAFGFVTSSTVTALDGSQTVTTNTYVHHTDNGKWLLGRLSQTTVAKTHPNKASVTKTSTFDYDGTTGLLTEETVEPGHPLSVTTAYTHDGFGNVTATDITASGQTRWSTTGYDARGRFVTSETNALGTVTHHYDPQRALLLATTDVNGRTTTFTYDEFGTQIATNHPNHTRSAEITFFAGNSDLPSQIQAELAAHHITLKWARCAEESGTPCATVYFDQVGREVVTETTVLTSASPSFAKQYALMLYDERGRLVKESSPFRLGDPIHYTTHNYDFLDRRIRTTRPDGESSGIVPLTRESLTGYGPCVKTITDNPLGRQLCRWTDQHERTVRTSDASAQVTTFDHDVEGRLTGVAIDGTPQLANTYDLLGNKTTVWDLSGGTSISAYNGFGEVTSTTNARGQTTTTAYDSLGRVTSVAKPEGTYLTTYRTSGENLGAVDEISGPGGYLDTFTYGENDHDYGLVIQSTTRQATGRPTYTTSTVYNALGQPLRATDAGGAVVETTYDATYGGFALETRLIATPDIPGGLDTLVSRAPTLTVSGNDLVATETLAHGITRTTTTDARNGFLKSLVTTGPGGTLQNHSYTWDAHGNLLTRTDGVNGETETFDYDTLDRLTSSQVAGDSAISYGYDAKGNLVSKAGETRSYANGDYRVTSATVKGASRSYSYDPAGFVTGDGQRSYIWTSFGQLASVTQTSAPAVETFFATGQLAPVVPGIPAETRFHSSNVTATFEFDAAGNRTRQVLDRLYNTNDHASVITRYLGSYELEEHVTFQAGGGYGENKILHRHRLGGATYLKETDASGTKLYLSVTLTDHIGSTDMVLRAEWDASQSGWKLSSGEPRAERQSFGAWGERREQSDWTDSRTAAADPYQTTAVAENHGYTGHEMLDDFGLIHMNGRIYDPELGRMLSPDPYVQVPEFSQNFNRYSYVLNNPLSHTDSSGDFIDWIVAAVYAVVEAVAAYGSFVAGAYSAGTAAAGVVGGVVAAAGAAVVGLAVPGLFLGPVIGGVAGAAIAVGNVALSAYSIGSTIRNGGSWGDVLRGVAVGFVTAAISAGVLHDLGTTASTAWKSGNVAVATEYTVKHVAGHAVLGGLSQEAMGGSFQDGFLSAGVSTLAMDLGISRMLGLGNPGDGDFAKTLGRTAVAGMIGGTAAEIGGGKFANGAYTAAFQHLFNAEGGRTSPRTVGEDPVHWNYDPAREAEALSRVPYLKAEFLSIAWESDFEGSNAYGSRGILLWVKKNGDAAAYNVVSGGSAVNRLVIGKNSRIPSGVWQPGLNGNNTLPEIGANGAIRYPNSKKPAAPFIRHGISFKFYIPTPGTGRGDILFHPTPGSTDGCVGLCGPASQLIEFRDRFMGYRGARPKLYVP